GEVDLLLFLVPFVHREVDDPAELEAVLVDESEIGTNLGARRPRELDEILGLAGDEEHGVADAKAELLAHRLRALRPEVARGPALLAVAPEDVAEARLTLALRPRIHPIAERAVAPALRRDRPHFRGRIARQDVGEDLEAGAAKRLAHVRHLDRVAQVGLVAAI